MREAVVVPGGAFEVALCAGKTQPFCHGRPHQTSRASVEFEHEQDGSAALCGCGTGQGGR